MQEHRGNCWFPSPVATLASGEYQNSQERKPRGNAMIRRLAITAILAAVIAVPIGVHVSHAEPLDISLEEAKMLPVAEELADGQRPLALPESQRSASVAPMLLEESRLSKRLNLLLRPTPLTSPAEPGQRAGHGDVLLSLLIGEWWQLRTGVRLDYDNRPHNGSWKVEGIPTVGIDLRF